MHSIINKTIMIMIVFASIGLINATDISIYYPNNNTTTDIYYAEGDGYSRISDNTVSGNFSIVILDDELEYDDIISEPHKIISPIFKIITVILMLTMLLIAVILIKRVWK